MTIVIIHGTYGNHQGNWFPWLAAQLRLLGHVVEIPQFPTPKKQSLKSWKNVFNRQFKTVQPDMVLVGHSLGAGFILNLLEQSSHPVLATFFVCGFIGKIGLAAFDVLNESFVCREFDWDKIRRNMGKAHLLGSDNDPYVSLAKLEELANKLQIPFTLIAGGEHLNTESGYTEFPLLLEQMQNTLEDKSVIINRDY